MAFDLASLNGTNGFRLTGFNGGDYVGQSVSSAGDVNGDGFDDIIIGAYGAYGNGLFRSGESYVVFGGSGVQPASQRLTSLDGTNGFALGGLGVNDYSGFRVSSLGDINGDGLADFAIGAVFADPLGRSNAGAVYVVHGSTSGFGVDFDLSSLNGSNGFTVFGEAGSDFLREVSSAGDINGDGFDDVIVGASSADNNGNNSGSAYVVFGSANGQAATLDLSTINGTNGFRLDGVSASDFLGVSVSSAGDLNGDGFDDIIIGASSADPNGLNSAGSSYVIFGAASGFGTSFDLSTLNGSNGFRLDGAATNDYAGRSVASAGDFNGDGFADIIVGASGSDSNGNISSGSSYVVFGGPSGFAATVDLGSLDGTDGFRLDGIAASDFSGFSVSSAGDVNGDGFDDILIGARSASATIYNAGATYLVFGTGEDLDPVLSLSELSLNGSLGAVFNGIAGNERSGTSVSGAGDMNGDGYDDIVIGAPGGLGGAGISYVIYGGVGFDETFTGTMADDEINGGAGADNIDGGGGTNRVTFETSNMAVRADLIVGGQAGDAAGDTYTNINDFDGSAFDDVLLGDNAANDLFGGGGNDRLLGRDGADTLRGGIGDDILLGGAGADILNGGAGIDTASYFSSTSRGVDVSLLTTGGIASSNDAQGDIFISIENLEGTNLANDFDRLQGNNSDNGIFGFAGNDFLYGLAGNDELFGGTGNDFMEGGLGRDLLNGGSGIDTASYANAGSAVRVDMFFFGQNQGEAAGDVFGDMENVLGGIGNDVLLGNGVGNVLTSGDGNDRLFGRGGADTLEGGLGADRLGGGFGGATASDGAADTFLFTDIAHSTVSGLGRDTIIDFWRADGDRVDLSSVDAIAGGADDTFTFIGNVGFSGVAGQLRYAAPINQIQGDVDGDGAADFAIQVDNVANMIVSDFIL